MTGNYKAIRRYVRNEMSAVERDGFESEMRGDPFLSDSVDGFQSDPGALNDLPTLSHYHYLWVYGLIGVAFLVGLVFIQTPPKDSPQADKITEIRVDEFQPELIVRKPFPVIRDVKLPAPELVANAHPLTDNFEESIRRQSIDVIYAPLEKITATTINQGKPERSIAERSNTIYINDLKLVKPDDPLTFNSQPDLLELTGHLPAKYESADRFTRSTPKAGSNKPPYLQIWSEVFDAFHSGKYNTALHSIDKLEKTSSPHDVNIQFYRGLMLFHLSDFSAARRYFEIAERHINPGFRQEAMWYRALSSESLGDSDESEKIFQEIAREGGHYSKRAVERL
ncbi:MAG: tol-pal system YbgF family protein [Cryomorphaceae bacterium]